MSFEEGVQAKVALLAQGFRTRLPARLAALDEAFALCRSEPAAPHQWDELHRLLHSLGGAAGTFGLAPLGLAARAIEAQIAERQAAGPAWSADQIDAIGLGLEGLRAWLPAPTE